VANADAAAEMAKKLQPPLANIKAVMTDNSIAFDTGDDDGTSYGFQVQPVYAIDFPERGVTIVPGAVIPILGLEPGTKTRITGEDGNPIPSDSGSVAYVPSSLAGSCYWQGRHFSHGNQNDRMSDYFELSNGEA
jgi:hypothetical protein